MSFKTKKTILKIYLFLAIAACLGFSVWRIILLREHCNPYDMSFEDGALSSLQAFEYALLAFCALLSSCVIFAGKLEFKLFCKRASTTSVSICAFCGFMIFAVGILALIYYGADIFDFYGEASAAYRVFYIAALAMMFISALYFLGRASTALENSSSIAGLSLALPCFCIAYLGASYFNADLPLLDFNRVTSEMAFISVLMFALSEARLATGRGNYKFRFVASLICMVCVCSYIVPLLVLVVFWEMNMSLTTLTEVSLVAVLMYVTFSAFNAIRTLKETEKSEAA